MKRLALILSVLLCNVIGVNAQEWVGINGAAPIKIQERLVSSSEDEIVVAVKVGGYMQEKVMTPRGEQLVISGDGMAPMLETGAPDLPLFSIPIIIGDKAEMNVSVIKSKYVDFENMEVAPSKGNFSRKINPNDVPYVYGEMYQTEITADRI